MNIHGAQPPRGRPLRVPLLFLRALWRVASIRVLLTTISFPRVRRHVDRLSQARSRAMKASSPQAIAGAVRSASRLVPGASCLTQALAARVLLEQGEHASRLHIGVSREHGDFEAHAWVEHDGAIIIGDIERTFVSLPSIEP